MSELQSASRCSGVPGAVSREVAPCELYILNLIVRRSEERAGLLVPSFDNDYIEAATPKLPRPKNRLSVHFGLACLGVRLFYGVRSSHGPL